MDKFESIKQNESKEDDKGRNVIEEAYVDLTK